MIGNNTMSGVSSRGYLLGVKTHKRGAPPCRTPSGERPKRIHPFSGTNRSLDLSKIKNNVNVIVKLITASCLVSLVSAATEVAADQYEWLKPGKLPLFNDRHAVSSSDRGKRCRRDAPSGPDSPFRLLAGKVGTIDNVTDLYTNVWVKGKNPEDDDALRRMTEIELAGVVIMQLVPFQREPTCTNPRERPYGCGSCLWDCMNACAQLLSIWNTTAMHWGWLCRGIWNNNGKLTYITLRFEMDGYPYITTTNVLMEPDARERFDPQRMLEQKNIITHPKIVGTNRPAMLSDWVQHPNLQDDDGKRKEFAIGPFGACCGAIPNTCQETVLQSAKALGIKLPIQVCEDCDEIYTYKSVSRIKQDAKCTNVITTCCGGGIGAQCRGNLVQVWEKYSAKDIPFDVRKHLEKYSLYLANMWDMFPTVLDPAQDAIDDLYWNDERKTVTGGQFKDVELPLNTVAEVNAFIDNHSGDHKCDQKNCHITVEDLKLWKRTPQNAVVRAGSRSHDDQKSEPASDSNPGAASSRSQKD